MGDLVNINSIIDGHDGDLVALHSRGRPTTYDTLRRQVEAVRGGLIERGVGVGDRVALLCGNNRQFVVSYLATVGIGAVAVPLNPASPANELERELVAAGAVAVVVDATAASVWRRLDTSALPDVRLVFGPDSASGTTLGEAVPFDVLIASDPAPMTDVDPDALAVLIFTSGTAGTPKAAMLSHRNLLSNIDQARSSGDRFSSDDVIYAVLPLFHIFGLNVVLSAGLAEGATVVLVQRFDPATAIESIRARKITVMPGVPTMWVAMSRLENVPDDAFHGVRLALSGASRLPVETAESMRSRFGLSISEGYGLTEASPVVTGSVGHEPRFGSIGKVLDGVDVKLVNEDGEEPPIGDPGEIWVRGDNVFLGYLDDPEATGRVLTPDGWLRTGDIAIVDEDGYLYLVDRAKDLVIVSGFNVFPVEVEDVLMQHPAVLEAGVVGIPHPHTGEAVKAFVVARPGMEIDEDALIDHAADHLARYKCPSKILFVDELPRNASGKLLRRSLGVAGL
ncbi:MAG: AMP-binding protein [Actinomycetota bacterium]|nr:AMP-binding protein [Actinomycetota bacterium]